MQGAGFRVQGAGCRAQGAGFRVQGAGRRVQGAGFRVQGEGFRVQGAGFRVQGAGCRVQGAGFRAQGAGCRVQGAGCRVLGEGFGFRMYNLEPGGFQSPSFLPPVSSFSRTTSRTSRVAAARVPMRFGILGFWTHTMCEVWDFGILDSHNV